MGASQRPGGPGSGQGGEGPAPGPGPRRRHEQEQGTAAAARPARSSAWEGALVAPDASGAGRSRPAIEIDQAGPRGGAHTGRRGPGGEQATVEILIPLCQRAEYEAAKAALWQWRTRWRREITYSFKSNLRRRIAPERAPQVPALPDPLAQPRVAHGTEASGILPTVWVVKASARALADLPGGYLRRAIPDLVPRWGVIACVRDQYTDNGRGERQYGTKHFTVGTEVYAHPPFSPTSAGSYERALFTGLHRQTKRFVTVMQPTLRFEDWRVGEISHPVVLHEFRTNGVWEHSGALQDARRLSHQMNERIFRLKVTRPQVEVELEPESRPDLGPGLGPAFDGDFDGDRDGDDR
jgi:hypothetical protein